MKELLSYWAYRVGWLVVGALPSSIAYALFRTIADYSYQRNGKSVQRMRANYRIIQPHSTPEQLEQLIQLGMRSYMRYWCDTFRIHTWKRSYIEQTVSLSHDELLRNPMNQGRGVIIALPHSGNWDHAGAYFCGQGFPLVTVAEVLKPEKLFQKFLSYREKMGFEVLPLGSRTFITLMRKARDKRLIALVADRDLSDSGVEVNFFGHRAKMPAGPALLAIKEGLPLVVAHVSYTSLGIHINFTEIAISDAPFESDRIQETVQRCADAFAVGISAHPEDWHMLQRIWIEEGIYS